MMNLSIVVYLLQATIRSGTPVLYAALGEILAERTGVLNLGVEGMMLMGAATGFTVGQSTSNPWIGLLAAMLAGGVMALLFGFLTITLKADPVVSGLALVIFGTGFSGYIGKPYALQPPRAVFKPVNIPILSDIPYLGEAFFNHSILVYLSFFLVPGIWYFINRTRPGLHMRAVGENPAAADAMGITVNGTRYFYTFLGGAFAGIGGAYLSLAYSPAWAELMTASRGWIAIGLVIFSGWNPLIAMAGSYLFGGVDAISLGIQAAGAMVSSFFLNMLPFILTILVLIFAARRRRGSTGPAALGMSYDRESH